MDSLESAEISLVTPRRTSARKARKRSLEMSTEVLGNDEEQSESLPIKTPVRRVKAEKLNSSTPRRTPGKKGQKTVKCVAKVHEKSASEPPKKRGRPTPTISTLESEILSQLAPKKQGEGNHIVAKLESEILGQLSSKRIRKPTLRLMESDILGLLSPKARNNDGNRRSRNFNAEADVSTETETSVSILDVPKKRGRRPKSAEIATESIASSDPPEKSSTPISKENNENCELVAPTPKKRGRKPKSIEDYFPSLASDKSGSVKNATQMDDDVSVKLKKLNLVTCGVCKTQTMESNFAYHRYSIHMGLARAEGESQEFSPMEKKHEMKRALDKVKRLTCPICASNFTTVPGFLYHQERCGVSVNDLKNMQTECTICGKRVMAMKVHLKVHEKEEERKAEDLRIEEDLKKRKDTPVSKSGGSKGKTPRRVAAIKAVSLFKEIVEESSATESATESTPSTILPSKAAKLFVEPSGCKVTNSIIGVWKRQLEKEEKARCRYPACSFASSDIDELRQHHVTCEIGMKSKLFGCLKCAFQCLERPVMVQHVLDTHVSEKDATFELGTDHSDVGEEYNNDEEEEEEDDDDEDEEEEEIELSDGETSEKVVRPNSAPTKLKSTERAFGITPTLLHQFKNLQTPPCIPQWLAEFHKKNFSIDSLFADWQPKFERIENLSDYSPSNDESILFARRKVNESNLHPEVKGITYEKLRKFEAKLHHGTPMFFCGGPIHSVAWCPTPVPTPSLPPVERDQYLAVSAFRNEDNLKTATLSHFSAKYVIQIWNCGKLRQHESPTAAPKLELCIAHDYGRVWSLLWCPSGCYTDTRLGVLAAACSDGTVRLFSVPHSGVLERKESEPLALKAEPSLSLALNVQDASECTSLHWDSTQGHRFIIAGFANGVVAVWNLKTQSPLLLNDKVLYPIWSFYAHSSVVTAVSLSPHHNDARFIVTASVDRSVKLWDRYDCALPVCWSKRSRVTDIKWRRHWPGVLVCVEDVCALFRSTTMFYDFGYTGNKQALIPQNSVAWCAAENEFLDLLVHSTAAGEIVIYSSHFAIMDCDDKKLRRSRQVIFRTDLVDLNEKGSECVVNIMKKGYLQSTKKPSRSRTGAVRQLPTRYSLVFNDVAVFV